MSIYAVKVTIFLHTRIGGESLAVAQNTYAVSWFKGKELNTVFGLQLSMARVGSTVNFLSMVPLYNWVLTFSEGYRALGYSLLFGMYCGSFFILNCVNNHIKCHCKNSSSCKKSRDTEGFILQTIVWLAVILIPDMHC